MLAGFVTTPDPAFSLQASPRFSLGRETAGIRVDYWVNPEQWEGHPFSRGESSPQRWEKQIEQRWVSWKYDECVRSRERIDRRIEAQHGVFGFGTNWDEVKRLKEERSQVPSCQDLRNKGYLV